MYCRILSILICFTFGASSAVRSQPLVNNFTNIYIMPGAQVYVKTNSVNNNGLINNGGELTIERDFINNDTATSGGATGFYAVQRDWINNATFIADQGKVNLYGDNQLITGSSITVFYDLELTGTGIKQQTINSETTHLLMLNDRELATDSFEMFVSNPDTGAITRSSGFVSSLGNGRLLRNTNNASSYLFPTGSSAGTARYRPVEISPGSAANNTFGLRLANADATTESFNRNTKSGDICVVNPLFYHRIYHTQGSDSADVTLYYIPTADGDWQDAAHWQNNPQWELTNATASVNAGFSAYSLSGWNNFSYPAFALANRGPTLSLSPNDATCNGADDGAISSAVSGGTLPYDYIWNTSDTTADLQLISGGTYTLTITDSAGCSATQSATIEEPDVLSATESITNLSCVSDTDGAIKLNPIGGTAPYYVTWSNGDTSLSIIDLPLGVYEFVLTDSNGCELNDSVELTAESVYSVEAGAVNASCTGVSNGSITATIITATSPPYVYLWSTGDTTASVNNISPGTYSVTVYDIFNCFQQDTVIVGADGLSIAATVDDASCPGIADGDIETSVAGGTTPYTYSWNSGASSGTLSNIPAGTYFLTVTDVNACAGNDTIIVETDATAPCDSLTLYDIFSPNGDGANDTWIIDGLLPVFENNELQIFNRWGNVVYEAKPYTNTWDGATTDNEPLPVATYYYILKLHANSKVYSGNVTIVR